MLIEVLIDITNIPLKALYSFKVWNNHVYF